MQDESLERVHRELFVWMAHRHDVGALDLPRSEFTIAPRARKKEDGTDWPTSVTITLTLDEFSSAWPGLLQAGQDLGLGLDPAIPELAGFNLLDVHLDEAVNSMRLPGARGYRYTDGSFVAH